MEAYGSSPFAFVSNKVNELNKIYFYYTLDANGSATLFKWGEISFSSEKDLIKSDCAFTCWEQHVENVEHMRLQWNNMLFSVKIQQFENGMHAFENGTIVTATYVSVVCKYLYKTYSRYTQQVST